MQTSPSTRTSDLIGVGRLALDAVRGLTNVVEAMHGTIARVPLPLGGVSETRTTGITRLVYNSIRGVTGLLTGGVEVARRLQGSSEPGPASSRNAWVAALNGVVGDYLDRTNNALAIPTRLHVRDGFPTTNRVLVLVHGLCSNQFGWRRRRGDAEDRDHGEALARSLGFTPVYAEYNSGRHISTNGRELATALDQLVATWPVPITELVLLGHSMGGLVSRSACGHAETTQQRWLGSLTRLICLGTPHHGAPLERIGNRAQALFELSPYAAPIIRIGGERSAGIRDLRFGNVRDDDWDGTAPAHHHDARTPLPLPHGVECFAIAGTRGPNATVGIDRLAGDGLVPVASALGQHDEAGFALAFPEFRRRVIARCSHMDLLDHPLVYEQLAAWLGVSAGAS